MKRIHLKGFLQLAVVLLTFSSCSDLEIEETDRIIDYDTSEGGIFNGVESVPTSLDNIYNRLGGSLISVDAFFELGDYAWLQEVSTDEQFVPTRGTDWGDNGVWRSLHSHSWNPAHDMLISTWNAWNETIFLASEVIDPKSNPSTEQEAQARFTRAYATWVVMDLFGQVPNRAPDQGPEILPEVLSRPEALESVLNDLDIAIAGLPSSAAEDMNNLQRGTKAAARFLKARVLLNSGVYNGTGNPQSLDEVITLVDAIEADGFALQSGYFTLFEEHADTETIFWLPSNIFLLSLGPLHYTQGGFNGFSTLAEFYDLFEGPEDSNSVGSGQEERRGFVPGAEDANEINNGVGNGFLIGQQYNSAGNKLQDRTGKDLVYTRDFPGLIGVGEGEGIRVLKYHPGNPSRHFIVFRYSDAYLMKAEAILRSGGDATAIVNELRILRNASPLPSVSEKELLEERGRELYLELVRRTDLIRFGQFTRDWEFKDPTAVGDETKNLYPIPSNALLSNPNLVQNPGY